MVGRLGGGGGGGLAVGMSKVLTGQQLWGSELNRANLQVPSPGQQKVLRVLQGGLRLMQKPAEGAVARSSPMSSSFRLSLSCSGTWTPQLELMFLPA